MCRKRLLYGCVLLSMGIGILIGQWFQPRFLCTTLGLLLLAGGIFLIYRK